MVLRTLTLRMLFMVLRWWRHKLKNGAAGAWVACKMFVNKNKTHAHKLWFTRDGYSNFYVRSRQHVFGPPQQVTTTRTTDIYWYIFIQMVGTKVEVYQQLEGMFYRKEFVPRLLPYVLHTHTHTSTHTHTQIFPMYCTANAIRPDDHQQQNK